MVQQADGEEKHEKIFSIPFVGRKICLLELSRVINSKLKKYDKHMTIKAHFILITQKLNIGLGFPKRNLNPTNLIDVCIHFLKGGSKVQFLGQGGACNSAPNGPNDLKFCMQGAFVCYY